MNFGSNADGTCSCFTLRVSEVALHLSVMLPLRFAHSPIWVREHIPHCPDGHEHQLVHVGLRHCWCGDRWICCVQRQHAHDGLCVRGRVRFPHLRGTLPIEMDATMAIDHQQVRKPSESQLKSLRMAKAVHRFRSQAKVITSFATSGAESRNHLS